MFKCSVTTVPGCTPITGPEGPAVRAYDRFRLYLNLDMPIVTKGDAGGTLGAYLYNAPSGVPAPLSVDFGTDPTASPMRASVSTPESSAIKSPFRLGAGLQLFIPNGHRADYDTDMTYRGMVRVLVAGDVGSLASAGHLGVHVRPRDESHIREAPREASSSSASPPESAFPWARPKSWT